MGEAFIVRKGGVTGEPIPAPTITLVSKTDSSITFTLTNNSNFTQDVTFGLTTPPTTTTITLAAAATSGNQTFSNLDDDTTFIIFAQAADGVISQLSVTTDALEVPETISNLFSWYDATKITGLSNNDAVATWADSSGNNRNLTQSTASRRPTFQTNARNGLPVVDFDGTDDFLQVAFTGNQLNTYFLVYKFDDIPFAANRMIFDSNNNSGRQILFHGSQGRGLTIFAGSDTVTGFASTTNFEFTTIVFNTNNSFARRNGSQSNTLNPGTLSMNGLRLATTPNTDQTSDIKIAEFIMYNKVCSGTEITDVENYLKDKWGFV